MMMGTLNPSSSSPSPTSSGSPSHDHWPSSQPSHGTSVPWRPSETDVHWTTCPGQESVMVMQCRLSSFAISLDDKIQKVYIYIYILTVFISHDHHQPDSQWASTVRNISESEGRQWNHSWAPTCPIPSHLTCELDKNSTWIGRITARNSHMNITWRRICHLNLMDISQAYIFKESWAANGDSNEAPLAI